MGNKLLRSSRKSAKRFETPVASSITTYVGISRSPQAKKEMEKGGRRSRHAYAYGSVGECPTELRQADRATDKVGLLEYADNVVKKLPRAAIGSGFFMLCDTTLYIMSTKAKS